MADAATLKVIGDLGTLATTAIGIIKAGIGLGSLKQLVSLGEDVKTLISDVPAALPELGSLDASDAADIANAAYGVVKSVIAALA